jgi:CheY-like chemotaxis protein
VLLLDMGLPRCDGPTTVREIRQDRQLAGLKIVAVSGHLPEEFNLTRGPGGIDRWFTKPLDPSALIRDLERELE